MKKSKLVITYDFDFELTGVATTTKGYKLAWAMNRKMGIHLVRQPDLVVGFRKLEEKNFLFYSYETRLNRLKLFKNKPVDSQSARYLLVPEFPHFDFIILTQGGDPSFAEMVVTSLKELDYVELVAPIPTQALKSKVNFIF